MTRGTLRVILERQLNDVTNQDWDVPALDEALDWGVLQVAKLQFSILPDSLRARSKVDIEDGVDLYSKPPDAWMIYKVRLMDSDGKYQTLTKEDYDVTLERVEGDKTTWSHFGRYVAILPTPTENKTNGLQIIYVPGAGMTLPPGGTTDDEIPSVHVGLHRLIVTEAAIALLPETGEATKELKDARDREWKLAPTWLRSDVAEPDQFVPQIDKEY